MANIDLVVPLVVAIIGLLGSLLSIWVGWRSQRDANKANDDLEKYKAHVAQELETFKLSAEHGQNATVLTEKYSQPLLVAAYDLQQRLYDLVEYPISRQQLETPDGLEDIKMFTCYLLAQYRAFCYILRTKLGYLSFAKNERLIKLRKLMYIIDEELDRRRERKWSQNVGVWPAARILVSERMLREPKECAVNAALDGGFGSKSKASISSERNGKKHFSSLWDTSASGST